MISVTSLKISWVLGCKTSTKEQRSLEPIITGSLYLWYLCSLGQQLSQDIESWTQNIPANETQFSLLWQQTAVQCSQELFDQKDKTFSRMCESLWIRLIRVICPNTCGIQSFITTSLEPVFSYKKHYKLRYSQRTLWLEVSSSKLCMFLIYRRASFSVRCFHHPRGYKPYKANLCRRNDGSRAVTQRGERQTQLPFTVALVEEFCNCIREESD